MELSPCPKCSSDNITEGWSYGLGEYVGCMDCHYFCSDWNNSHIPWISINSRLPEITRGNSSDDILMVVRINGLKDFVEKGSFIEFKNGNRKWRGDSITSIRENEVTHWMPVPKLPEDNS